MQALDLPAHARPRKVRRTEYERLAREGFFGNERVELIQGIVVEMSPIGPRHANPLDLLVERLVPPLVGRARVRVQQPFAATDDSEPEPDLAIVPALQYVESHPDRAFLVIEVAETSLDYDRETKAPIYAASGVPEYWVVNVAARCIEVFDQPKLGVYTRQHQFGVGSALVVPGFSDVSVRVGELFP
jgi:Uma2 family endonuclease